MKLVSEPEPLIELLPGTFTINVINENLTTNFSGFNWKNNNHNFSSKPMNLLN